MEYVMTTSSIPSAQSHLDKNIIFNKDEWAVTLIRATNSNHAEIVIEGIGKTNRQFLKVAHLVGQYSSGRPQNYGFRDQAEVKLTEISSDKLKYDGKTETWLRSTDLVLIMLAQIKNEKSNPKEYPVTFDILGEDSVFTKDKYQIDGTVKTVPWFIGSNCIEKSLRRTNHLVAITLLATEMIRLRKWEGRSVDRVATHSCITWAKDKLKMINVDLPKCDTGWFITQTKAYTE